MAMIDSNKLYRRIAGHSKYSGDAILTAISCLAEGKEIHDVPWLKNYVEVVRCWECVHRRKRECPLYNEKYMEYDMGYGDIEQVCKITDGTIDYGFCYKGERRGD